jgi:hypothetical protein
MYVYAHGSFVSGWRACSSVSLCTLDLHTQCRPGDLASLGTPSSRGRSGSSAPPCAAATRLCAGLACVTLLGCLAGPVARPLLSLGRGGLRLSAVACLAVALADMCGCVWSLSRVGVACVACVCLCLASALCLSRPMLLGVSLVPLCNTISAHGLASFVFCFRLSLGFFAFRRPCC